MSDITPDAPKATPTKATPKKRVNKPMTLSALVNTIATKNKSDATKTGKQVRSHIRSNFDTLAKEWPALKKSKKNKDGNRYPEVPSAVARKLIDKFTK